MPKPQQTVAADPPKQLPKSSIEWVDVKTLKIDKSYQREVNPRQVKRIVSDFQPEAYHPLLVGRRDSGADYVVDGLQRLAAGKKLKFTDVMCSVFSSDGRAHEAAIFGRVNKARTAITALNGYRAALVSGDEKTLAINKIIDRTKSCLALHRGNRNALYDREQTRRVTAFGIDTCLCPTRLDKGR